MLQAKYIKCGKNCRKCPHGAYIYLKWREGKKVISKYVGKCGDPKTAIRIKKLEKKYPGIGTEYEDLIIKVESKVNQNNEEQG